MTIKSNSYEILDNEWPEFLNNLEPELSVSNVAAVIPEGAIANVLAQAFTGENAQWNGTWSGWGSQGRSVDVKIVVQQLSDSSAQVITAFNSPATGIMTDTVNAVFVDDELRGTLSNGSTIIYCNHPLKLLDE